MKEPLEFPQFGVSDEGRRLIKAYEEKIDALQRLCERAEKRFITATEMAGFEVAERDARITALEAALVGLLEHYINLANSGDAGFWDPEKEPVVINARAALTPPKDSD